MEAGIPVMELIAVIRLETLVAWAAVATGKVVRSDQIMDTLEGVQRTQL